MFYRNADAAEAVAAPEINILAEMATNGKVNNGEGGEIPKYIPKVQTQTEENEGASAVAATEPNNNQNAEGQQVAEKVLDGAAQTETPQQAKIDWREMLKQEQSKTVLTELGYDEKMVNFLEFWKSGGDVQQYIKELNTNYAEMPAEELMKHQLKREYPNASERQIELLYKREVVDKFQLDPDRFDEQEIEEGRLLLDAYASKFRGEIIKEQESRLLPPSPSTDNELKDKGLAEQQSLVDNAKQDLIQSDFYREVLKNNAIVIGEGNDSFKFPIDAKELPDIIYDSEKFAQNLFNIKNVGGKTVLIPDVEKQVLVSAVAKHGMGLIVELAKHYKSVGSQKAVTPIENPSPIGQPQSASAANAIPDSPAAMLAKFGRLR